MQFIALQAFNELKKKLSGYDSLSLSLHIFITTWKWLSAGFEERKQMFPVFRFPGSAFTEILPIFYVLSFVVAYYGLKVIAWCAWSRREWFPPRTPREKPLVRLRASMERFLRVVNI